MCRWVADLDGRRETNRIHPGFMRVVRGPKADEKYMKSFPQVSVRNLMCRWVAVMTLFIM